MPHLRVQPGQKSARPIVGFGQRHARWRSARPRHDPIRATPIRRAKTDQYGGGHYEWQLSTVRGGRVAPRFLSRIDFIDAIVRSFADDPIKAMEAASAAPPPVDRIPAKYNFASELKAEVKKEGRTRWTLP